MPSIDKAPLELVVAIQSFWSEEHWQDAADVSFLESAWDAFALRDTTTPDEPCGTPIDSVNGVVVTSERSVGYFQINACNFPDWEWARLYNAMHNAGTAHMLWDRAGKSWRPWYFSARKLGLL